MNNSGWRGLDDTRLDRLFEGPRTFRAEMAALGEQGGHEGEISDMSSWVCDFEGHQLRLAEISSPEGRVFALDLDGEPIGELDRFPAGWKIEGLST